MDLALKFRPKCWAEVVGQEAIVSILQRQIATKKWKNTYLFAGPYGCGKTTVARILANEINNGEGQPIEIDSASNNGVDNIRNLILDSQQCSIDSEYKIYIIDEAHQLTKAAWDAALKLIEEPPISSIFIFCTTNISKIPYTILSRVQTFQFKRVDKEVIFNRLEFIMNEEFSCIKYDKKALQRISILANGHVRDSIKLLEKCLDALDELTLNGIESILGLVKLESLCNLNNSVVNKDLNECLKEVEHIKSYSSDLSLIYDDIIDFSINCSLMSTLENIDFIPHLYSDMKKELKLDKNINKVFTNRLIYYRKYLNESNAETFLKNIFLEICV